jgi:glycosyltransferase involved in cell wall biosynthesis
VPTPVISIVIPAYNAAADIRTALESVFAQTFSDYEVIVVNDGSPDTPALEAALTPYRNRITYLRQANSGPSGARNQAIRHAAGELIAFLDSDDEWMPGYLERQVRELRSVPGTVLVYSDGVIVGGALDGKRLMAVTPSHAMVTTERLIAEECVVLTSCAVARRDALVAAGMFDERFRRSEDAHLWLRLSLNGGRMSWHRHALVRHRRRPGSLSDDRPAMLKAYADVLEDLEARFPFTPAQRSLIHRQIARRRAWMAREEGRRLFLEGRYPEAASALASARRLEPARTSQLRLGLLRAGIQLAPRLLRRAYALMRPTAVTVLH